MERRRPSNHAVPGTAIRSRGLPIRRVRLVAVVAVAILGLGACGGDDGDGISVDGAWARTSPAMAEVGAAYMELSSSAGDRLIRATVDPGIAAFVELHETVAAGTGDDSDGDDSDGHADGDDHGDAGEMEGMGAMEMRQVSGIDIPAGGTVALEPGGLHVMLIGLAAPLELDQTFDLTLEFENAGEQVVQVQVRDDRP